MRSDEIKRLQKLIRQNKITTAKGVLIDKGKSATWLNEQSRTGAWVRVEIGSYCLYADREAITGHILFFESLGEKLMTATQILEKMGKPDNRYWLRNAVCEGEISEVKVTNRIRFYCENERN